MGAWYHVPLAHGRSPSFQRGSFGVYLWLLLRRCLGFSLPGIRGIHGVDAPCPPRPLASVQPPSLWWVAGCLFPPQCVPLGLQSPLRLAPLSSRSQARFLFSPCSACVFCTRVLRASFHRSGHARGFPCAPGAALGCAFSPSSCGKGACWAALPCLPTSLPRERPCPDTPGPRRREGRPILLPRV